MIALLLAFLFQADGCGACAHHSTYQQVRYGYLLKSACNENAPCFWSFAVYYDGSCAFTYAGRLWEYDEDGNLK